MRSDIQKEINVYRGAFSLESVLPRRVRSVLLIVLLILALLFGIVSALQRATFITILPDVSLADAAFLILLGAWLFLALLSAYSNSYYFRGMSFILDEGGLSKKTLVLSYESARVLSKGKADITSAFLKSSRGKEIVERCGVSSESIIKFLNTRKISVPHESVGLPEGGIVTLKNVSDAVFDKDKEFSQFLFESGITEDIYKGASAWVVRSARSIKQRRRWWSRDNLGRIPGVGADWSYGGAYALAKYSKDLSKRESAPDLPENLSHVAEAVLQLETILIRAREANAIIIGEEGVGKMEVINTLSKKIREGEALPPLAHRHVTVLDTDAFVAAHGEKAEFEKEFIKVLKEASKAGNVVLVIENLGSFLSSASALGSDLANIMDPYLSSSDLQVVATSDPGSFHRQIESQPQFMKRFEEVQIVTPGVEGTVRVLTDVVPEYEKKGKVLFTYQSLLAIADSADRYITYGVMPDKAVDLLIEMVPVAESKGVRVVGKELVSEYVEQKTGVPGGAVDEEEKEKLLNLENILHKRIIGQNAAVDAISSVMRRTRAGIQDPKKPLGSFLFLGPTGVGKTETAKALAGAFFESEERIMRFDMSEYNTGDALDRLIGSFESGKPGALASMLKEKPYGVLLLDEFEKTTDDVIHLFLQVLDEGFFSDAQGKKVSARNVIIIATSNAGSDLIWELTKEGKDVVSAKEEIVDTIIKRGVYTPELLNRFNAVIVFHPLEKEHLRKIAGLMLERLASRIRKKGYELVPNDTLVDLLVSEGYNPQFGARQMQRVLQERIEEKVAEKIIAGSLKPGAKIEFSSSDFA